MVAFRNEVKAIVLVPSQCKEIHGNPPAQTGLSLAYLRIQSKALHIEDTQ